MPEWTAADHHSSDDDKLAASGAQAAAQRPASASPTPNANPTQLVDVAWRQQCATCHGAGGRGDGPMGPMVHPPDLTSASWQAQVTDAEMLSVLRTGKGRMPRFDLPEPVLLGLVQRVRSLRGP